MIELIADDLGHRFGRRVLFRGIGFRLGPGDALAVTGANGSGKSTLLQILAGVLRPRKGSVRIEAAGAALPSEVHPMHVGLVAPYLGVYDDLTARENLDFLARARRLPGRAGRVAAALDRVGLGDRADDRVGTFSSGMRQRVRIAAAVLTDPPLLLLDEPSSNLDAPGVALVRRVVATHREEGGVLVLATNDAAEAALCARSLSVEDFR